MHNDDNAVINNKYGRMQDFILVLKIPLVTQKISSNFIDNLDTRPQMIRHPSCKI